ncbi:MAG: hypothetical protein FJ280_01785 [Planctomycetes bacterium]|nr:hypothetical protein [Planctomycetota bacterium]
MSRHIKYHTLFRLFEVLQPWLKYSLPLEEGLPGDSALVLSPHQDDEAIGCGGTLVKHTRAGGNAAVVHCTRETAERDQEASAAAEVLGVRDLITLPFGVETLKKQEDLADRFVEIFEERRPDVVLLPFWLDNHVDHRAVNQALLRLAGKKTFRFMVYAYPVWFPLHPNLLIDIGPVWEEKKRAILCYRTQVATRDYVRMSGSLGQYWAVVKGRNLEMVESFFRATFSEYVSMGRKILG